MEKALVSVIIPAFRCAGTLEQSIDSALGQEVPLEVLVIDDDPSGGLASVMERYRQEPRVRWLKNSGNIGAAASRNRGVSEARGDYIAFLDGDDIWAPGKLARQLRALETTGAPLCCTGRALLTPEGIDTGRYIGVREEITYQELLKHNSINCSSVLMKAAVARAFPMEHEDSHEDYILWLKILKRFGPAVGIDEPLLKYRLSTTGKSGNKLRSARMTFRVYRYMGFGLLKSAALFCSYGYHGVKKYALSRLGEKNEA